MSALADMVTHALASAPAFGDGQTYAERAVAATRALETGEAQRADPYRVLHLAAHGDLEAMRHMASEALRLVLSGDDPHPLVTLHEGAMFARMAAALSGEGNDHLVTVFLLGLSAQYAEDDFADAYAGEMVALLEAVADLGGDDGEEAARILTQSAEAETADIMELAKLYKERLAAAKGA